MFAQSRMVETLETRRFLSASPAAGDLAFEAPPPQEVGLLLPAVQAAREAARRASTQPPAGSTDLTAADDPTSTQGRLSCSNNLKQLGLAVHY